jgi:hypothetical protein
MAASSTKLAPEPESLLIANTRSSIFKPQAHSAHSYWEAQGCQGRSLRQDWFRAEEDLHGWMAQAASY